MAAALAEMCFGAGFGASVDLSLFKTRADLVLFSETAGCFLAEVEDEKVANQLFAKVPHVILGKTITDTIIRVNQSSKKICEISASQLKSAWQKPMEEIFH